MRFGICWACENPRRGAGESRAGVGGGGVASSLSPGRPDGLLGGPERLRMRARASFSFPASRRGSRGERSTGEEVVTAARGFCGGGDHSMREGGRKPTTARSFRWRNRARSENAVVLRRPNPQDCVRSGERARTYPLATEDESAPPTSGQCADLLASGTDQANRKRFAERHTSTAWCPSKRSRPLNRGRGEREMRHSAHHPRLVRFTMSRNNNDDARRLEW